MRDGGVKPVYIHMNPGSEVDGGGWQSRQIQNAEERQDDVAWRGRVGVKDV